MRERHPPTPADLGQPLFVRTVGWKVIGVALDGQTGPLQDVRERCADVAIGEEDKRHAARSKTTASSTAVFVRP